MACKRWRKHDSLNVLQTVVYKVNTKMHLTYSAAHKRLAYIYANTPYTHTNKEGIVGVHVHLENSSFPVCYWLVIRTYAKALCFYEEKVP